MSSNKRYRIGVDTGGTFVDAVEFDESTGDFKLAKSPTTPSDPSIGVLRAIEKLGTPLDKTYLILHGTTLGVNAIIERKGVLTGLISNDGFSDIFEIGRGDVPAEHMYDYNYKKPIPLVRRRYTAGVPCRLNYRGEVIRELDKEELIQTVSKLVERGVRSLAISFLHSYKNPQHEQEARAIIEREFPSLSVSVSSDVVREYREYERTSTTVLDAYIKPIVSGYVKKLDEMLRSKGFRGILLIMRSDGGVMTANVAAISPISTVQSGPAGGVVGAIMIARSKGIKKLITMDIGGTSLDVCVIENGTANVIHQTEIGHYPTLVTMYDIRSIGAGGGSIASVKDGLLKVGPESAGAEPGPMCYDKGGKYPTVTDACIVLGYIDPSRFLAGEMKLNPELSKQGIEDQIAKPLGVDLVDAAAGIIKVMVANSMGALRQITVEEGRDPADFDILAFGGAGPLFASILAEELGVREAIIPRAPAAFSAWGMLMSDISYELSQTNIAILDAITLADLREAFRHLDERVKQFLAQQRAPYKKIMMRRSLELRYLGQEHTLEVFIDGHSSIGEIRAAFDDLHFARFGHKLREQVEIVNLRTRGIGLLDKPRLRRFRIEHTQKPRPAYITKAYCLVTNRIKSFPVYLREKLSPGTNIKGPAIIDEGVSRTILHTGQSLEVDEFLNMVIKTTIK